MKLRFRNWIFWSSIPEFVLHKIQIYRNLESIRHKFWHDNFSCTRKAGWVVSFELWLLSLYVPTDCSNHLYLSWPSTLTHLHCTYWTGCGDTTWVYHRKISASEHFRRAARIGWIRFLWPSRSCNDFDNSRIVAKYDIRCKARFSWTLMTLQSSQMLPNMLLLDSWPCHFSGCRMRIGLRVFLGTLCAYFMFYVQTIVLETAIERHSLTCFQSIASKKWQPLITVRIRPHKNDRPSRLSLFQNGAWCSIRTQCGLGCWI